MLEQILRYNGLDLIAMVFTFYGIYKIGNKQRNGFIIATIGNILWLFFSLATYSLGIFIANIGLTYLNIRGYAKWKKKI